MRLVPLNMFKPSSDFFTDRSKAMILLWIFFVIYVSRLFCLVSSLQPCDHLLDNDWPLGSLISLCFVTFSYGI